MSGQVIPATFAFRFELPLSPLPEGATTVPATDEYRIEFPSARLTRGPSPVEFWGGWSAAGLAFRCLVSGRKKTPTCDGRDPAASEGLQIWLDTRNTQTVHRATRFCRHFCFVPLGAGTAAGKDRPYAAELPIARAKEASVPLEAGSLRVASEVSKESYSIDAWIPAAGLTGYDPRNLRELGFYCQIVDLQHGDQFLTVNRDFPIDNDPSLWQILRLVD